VFFHDITQRSEGSDIALAGDADDAFSFLVTFANGGWGSMSASFVAPLGSGVRIEIYGGEGAISTPQPRANPPPDGVVLGGRLGEAGQLREMPIPRRFRPITDGRDTRLAAFRVLAQRFRKGISEGTSPTPNFCDGYRCQQVIDAVQGPATGSGWAEIRTG
jgi:predicted dehydrogenase